MTVIAEGMEDAKTGINGVILSPALLTALYAEVLVPSQPAAAVAETRKKKPAADPVAVVSIGENRRNICMLVSVPGNEVLPAKTTSFLEKMLAACQLGIPDLAIVNTRLSPVSVPDLIARFSPQQWLLAGIPPASLGMNLPETHFEVLSWQDSKVLLLPALSEIDQNTAAARLLKRQLWTGLQTLFGL